jgi:hypothetical protein
MKLPSGRLLFLNPITSESPVIREEIAKSRGYNQSFWKHIGKHKSIALDHLPHAYGDRA